MSTNQSVKRAFSILKIVSVSPDGVGVTEISRPANLNKSTVSRMLSTLEEVGAVERLPGREGFVLGDEIALMAARISYPRNLITIARPFLLELAQTTGETVNLCIPDGDLAHYIDQIDSQYNLQIRDWTGYRIPVHASCDGKLYLAHWPAELIEEYLSHPLQSFSENTITNPDKLRAHLAEIRHRGLSWTYGEYEVGIVGISVPIWGANGQIIASLCVGGPGFRFPPEGEAEQIAEFMKELSRRIATRLRD
jgi:DNA-binding IclR family transcriptional regulator